MILSLRWDNETHQYKVNRPGDQTGEYVSLEFAQKLAIALANEIMFVETTSVEILNEAINKLQISLPEREKRQEYKRPK